MPKEVKLKKYEDVLMSALRFSEADLTANESGTLSAGQVRFLKQRRVAQAMESASVSAILALIILFLGAPALSAGGPLLWIIGLIMLSGLMIGVNSVHSITRDLHENPSAAEGRVELDMRTPENVSAYFVKLDGLKFKIKRDAFLAFKNGDPYRIYYAPHTKTILSVEWLRDDNPFEEPVSARLLKDTPNLSEPADELDRLLKDDDILREDTL